MSFSTKHADLMSKSKDWSAQNQDNVCQCGDVLTNEIFF